MGFAYEAAGPELGRHVALRLLSDAPAKNEHAVERFRREVRAASSLKECLKAQATMPSYIREVRAKQNGYCSRCAATFLVLIAAVLFFAADVIPQEQMMKVKGGHELGESAEQFFAEGHEKEALGACATGNFKSIEKPTRRVLKQYCSELSDARQQATSGKRAEYRGDGDPSEVRADTFTFDKDRLVKAEFVFAVPGGQTFAQIFTGVKQAYGPPTSEHTEQVQDMYGVPYLTHREVWESPQAVIVVTEQVLRRLENNRSTTLTAFTRAEYDLSTTSGVPRIANPLR